MNFHVQQQLSLIFAESSGQWPFNGEGAWSGWDGETGRLGGLPALTYGAVLNGGAVANGGLPNAGLPAKGKNTRTFGRSIFVISALLLFI